MKERFFVIVAAMALLVALMLPVLSSALTLSGGQQTSHEQVARRGTNALCQSAFTCGG